MTSLAELHVEYVSKAEQLRDNLSKAVLTHTGKVLVNPTVDELVDALHREGSAAGASAVASYYGELEHYAENFAFDALPAHLRPKYVEY
ncbi:hypothetical protein [Xanthomonas phage NEB7]|nr:hypothetical protein [Xanthomonas phage NEB7]